MKTAVLVQTHKNSDYLCLLAKNNPQVQFYIHVDKKAQETYDSILLENINNIELIENRISVFWGGSSQIAATLLLLNKALNNKNNKYFHFISGECYPLKSFEEIENEWDQSPCNNYIESHIDTKNSWRLKVRVPHSNTKYLRTFWGKVLNKLYKFSTYIYQSTDFDKNSFYFGSQWFSINRELASDIMHIYQETDFFKRFKNITCADEHAFQILVREYKYPSVMDDNKRYIFFEGKASPKYLSISEIDYVSSLDKYWFTRKVRTNDLVELLCKIKK